MFPVNDLKMWICKFYAANIHVKLKNYLYAHGKRILESYVIAVQTTFVRDKHRNPTAYTTDEEIC